MFQPALHAVWEWFPPILPYRFAPGSSGLLDDVYGSQLLNSATDSRLSWDLGFKIWALRSGHCRTVTFCCSTTLVLVVGLVLGIFVLLKGAVSPKFLVFWQFATGSLAVSSCVLHHTSVLQDPQSLLRKSIPTTWCCHHHISLLGWCLLRNGQC